jgi:hypothetical protein
MAKRPVSRASEGAAPDDAKAWNCFPKHLDQDPALECEQRSEMLQKLFLPWESMETKLPQWECKQPR